MATPKPISLNFFEEILLSHIVLRPAIVPLRRGGLVWRDTFYPLDELKRGVV